MASFLKDIFFAAVEKRRSIVVVQELPGGVGFK
jgi:hypothetical protein